MTQDDVAVGHAPVRDDAGERLYWGPVLMVFGVVLMVWSLGLSWNLGARQDAAEGAGSMWTGLDQALVNVEQGRFHGYLMLAAFALAVFASVMVLVASLMEITGAAAGAVSMRGAILGLVATAGVVTGYAALGALDEADGGMFVYAVSFVPVLVGAIGVAKRKF